MSVTRTATNGSCMITTTLCAEPVAGYSHSHRLRNRLLEESGGSLMMRIKPLKAASSAADVTLSFFLLLSRGLLLPWAQFAARLEMEWRWTRDLSISEGIITYLSFRFWTNYVIRDNYSCSLPGRLGVAPGMKQHFILVPLNSYVVVNVGETSWFCCSVVDVSCFNITCWSRRITQMFQLLPVMCLIRSLSLSSGQSGRGSFCFGKPQLLIRYHWS